MNNFSKFFHLAHHNSQCRGNCNNYSALFGLNYQGIQYNYYHFRPSRSYKNNSILKCEILKKYLHKLLNYVNHDSKYRRGNLFQSKFWKNFLGNLSIYRFQKYCILCKKDGRLTNIIKQNHLRNLYHPWYRNIRFCRGINSL
jgi:hypothetical protein